MKNTTFLLVSTLIATSASPLDAEPNVYGSGILLEINGTDTYFQTRSIGWALNEPPEQEAEIARYDFDNRLLLGEFDPSAGDTLVLKGAGIIADTPGGYVMNAALSTWGTAAEVGKPGNGLETSMSLIEDEIAAPESLNLSLWYTDSQSIDLLAGDQTSGRLFWTYWATYRYPPEDKMPEYIDTIRDSPGNFGYEALYTVVPEPQTYALAAGLLCFASVVFRRMRSRSRSSVKSS